MRDRQVFQEYKLANGLEVYSYPMEVPFGILTIDIPFGTVHNTGDIIPGTAHFLEHCIFNRSKQYPKKHEFEKKIKLDGGYFNAVTQTYNTAFYIEQPLELQPWAAEGLLAHLTDPIFVEEDLAPEKTIVINERRIKERWFPGGSEISQYLSTQWMNSTRTDLYQIFGSNDDLAQMSPEYVTRVHSHYFRRPFRVIVGGNIKIDRILKMFESVKIEDKILREKHELPRWVNREYHERTFRDASHPTYYWGGIVDYLPDPQTEKAIYFILNFLTNSTHGVLNDWLRRDKGWAYGVYHWTSSGRNHMLYGIDVPLNTIEQVKETRKEIHQRVSQALADKDLVATEVTRRKHESAFQYQTLERIVEAAEYDLRDRGFISSEKQQRELLEGCCTTAFLGEVYDKYLSPKVTGEFCALPEEK